MSDIISSNATSTPTGSAAETVNKRVEKPSLKLLMNRTRLGPTSGIKVAKAELSKATGKIIFDNQLKVKAVKEKEEDINPIPGQDKIEIPVGIDPAMTATKYSLAWDKAFHGSAGTRGYIDKFTEFSQAQKLVYDDLGISIAKDSKGKDIKPELTEQQRSIYNERMRKHAFQYYEYRLSYKQPGKKAVRSITYRTLKYQDLKKMKASLDDIIKDLEAKVTIVPKASV